MGEICLNEFEGDCFIKMVAGGLLFYTYFRDSIAVYKKYTPKNYCLLGILPLFILPLVLIKNTQNNNIFIIDQIRDSVTFMD
jgi:hypothetical protein